MHLLKTISFIFIFTFSYSNNIEWKMFDDHYYKPNELIVMFKSEISPMLGLEKPLDITTREDLYSLLNLNSKLEKVNLYLDFIIISQILNGNIVFINFIY